MSQYSLSSGMNRSSTSAGESHEEQYARKSGSTKPTVPGSSPSELRKKYALKAKNDQCEKILEDIRKEHATRGEYHMRKVEHKNILLIGRSRTGKSTIKSLLVDPTHVPDELTLRSGTKDPHFQAFHLQDQDTVLNIIDTPGLFEHSSNSVDIRDNEMILKTIGMCVNMEITKFHAICFAVSLTNGINQQDIESLKALALYFGPEASKNSCLIITRSESINEEHRENLKQELITDSHFKGIEKFFQLGIYFSGAINRDDFRRGNDSVYEQFFTVSDYRKALIELFLNVKDPIPLATIASSSSQFAKEYHNSNFKSYEASKTRPDSSAHSRTSKTPLNSLELHRKSGMSNANYYRYDSYK